MPLFAYRAVNAQGKNVAGRVEAANLFDLEQRLARMDLDLITGAPTEHRSRLIGGGRVARPDLINFCFHLEQLAKAGVPLLEGLNDLRESVENGRFREVISGLIESIEGGGAAARGPQRPARKRRERALSRSDLRPDRVDRGRGCRCSRASTTCAKASRTGAFAQVV